MDACKSPSDDTQFELQGRAKGRGMGQELCIPSSEIPMVEVCGPLSLGKEYLSTTNAKIALHKIASDNKFPEGA